MPASVWLITAVGPPPCAITNVSAMVSSCAGPSKSVQRRASTICDEDFDKANRGMSSIVAAFEALGRLR
jgi:hypothetical protein